MDAAEEPNRSDRVYLDFRQRSPRCLEPAPALAVNLSRSGPWLVLHVEGEMDCQALPLVEELVPTGSSFVIFTLGGITFIDAAGLGVIAETGRQAVAAGGCLRLVSPSRPARRLLRLTGQDRTLPQFDTLRAAVSTPFEQRATR